MDIAFEGCHIAFQCFVPVSSVEGPYLFTVCRAHLTKALLQYYGTYSGFQLFDRDSNSTHMLRQAYTYMTHTHTEGEMCVCVCMYV